MADSGVEGKGKKVIGRHGVLEKIMIDGSEANAAAIRSYNREHGTAIAICQVMLWFNRNGHLDKGSRDQHTKVRSAPYPPSLVH